MRIVKKSDDVKPSEPAARVKWSQGLTMTRNYNGMRFDCGVEIDCPVSEIEKTFSIAKKIAEAQLESALDDNKTVLGDLSAVTK
jgi:hypothetical protein